MAAMNIPVKTLLILMMTVPITLLTALEVVSTFNEISSYTLEELQKTELESFETSREKNGGQITESWQGVNLQKWLSGLGFTQFQSIRFESPDNYMVRITKAEYDSMPGYIALRRGEEWLDAKGIRVIFPAQREMYWIRGLYRIYVESSSFLSPPKRIYVWDAKVAKLDSVNVIEPWGRFSGYSFNQLMSEFFHLQAGSVLMVSRDGLKANPDYQQHLKDALLEVAQDGSLNLVSGLIPTGMWLKDIVYLQCDSVAVIRHDFLYRLPSLYEILDWNKLIFTGKLIRVSDTRTETAIEDLYLPDAELLRPEEWLELP